MFRVLLQPQARRFYAAGDRPLARKLARGFRILEETPLTHPGVRPLSGPLAGLHRLRLGDYRIIYQVDAVAGVVHVLRIAHRREAYR